MNSTQRFTQRAQAYAAARPSYPEELQKFLASLGTGTAVDLGCGTGLFSKTLLLAGWKVIGVEPNQAMAAHLDVEVKTHPCFRLQGAAAEQTELPDQSTDLVTAAQAFHWFDPTTVREEMERILVPGGQILLVWNTRIEGPGFDQAYSRLVDRFRSPEEAQTAHHRDWHPQRLASWFAPRIMREYTFSNQQIMDWPLVRSRAASTSYLPVEGTPLWKEFELPLKKAFEEFQAGGYVSQNLLTKVYLG